jgi:ectoine hydroxylase-related dioxygenase (phytanoyl-CoA dioxygenase family)
MQLSEQQLAHFRTFGFLVFRQHLNPDEAARFRREFDAGLDSWIEGRDHDGKARQYASLMEETTPFVAGLAHDPRFAAVAEQLLERDILCIAVDGNYQVGDTAWHPDTHTLNYLGVKFCIYPDKLTAANGALRVIPGSHLEPFHSTISRDADNYGVAPDQYPAFAFESDPGDVLVFNVATWHAAFGGDNKRRQGIIVYYEDPKTPEATVGVQETMKGNHGFYAGMGRRMYTDFWRSIDDPGHQRWISRLEELDSLETPAPADPS